MFIFIVLYGTISVAKHRVAQWKLFLQMSVLTSSTWNSEDNIDTGKVGKNEGLKNTGWGCVAWW